RKNNVYVLFLSNIIKARLSTFGTHQIWAVGVPHITPTPHFTDGFGSKKTHEGMWLACASLIQSKTLNNYYTFLLWHKNKKIIIFDIP
ncbi:hypothetical protein ACJX0J_019075, partial [Zea mays]